MKYHSKDEVVIELTDRFMVIILSLLINLVSVDHFVQLFLQGEVAHDGKVEACDVTVHAFVTSFLSGDPLATVTFNDKKVSGGRQGDFY